MGRILEVDVKNVLDNLKILSKDKEVCIPVKGNVYGLGLQLIDYLIEAGYLFFGVSTIQEAIYIRNKSKEAKILLFSAIFNNDIPIIKQYNIIITVYDFEILNMIDSSIKFHLKIDVGMGRLGFLNNQVGQVIEIIMYNDLLIEGIYTHLPQANNTHISFKQINQFKIITEKFKQQLSIKYIHLYNGLGSLKYLTTFDNLIRPGLATYGYFDNQIIYNQYKDLIKPTIKLKVRVGSIKEYYGLVGYDGIDHVYGKIISLPIGYHDGMRQNYHNYMIPNIGKIVGKVCMCQTLVLADQNTNIQKGQYIYLIANEFDLYTLSKHSQISVYEILSVLGSRISREYIQ